MSQQRNTSDPNRLAQVADNRFQDELLDYLSRQLVLGFCPTYLVTWHYNNPTEFRHRGQSLLLDSKGLATAQNRRRANLDFVSRDCQQIRNHLLKACWGIKRLHRSAARPPMLFFHEYGIGEQLHTHGLLPAPTAAGLNSCASLSRYCNQDLPQQCRSLSRDRSIDVRPVHDPTGLLDYLVKEVSVEHCSLDQMASIALVPQPDGSILSSSFRASAPKGHRPAPDCLAPSRRSGSTWRCRS